MQKRKLCAICEERPVAVNCYRGDKVYYRRLCDTCIRKGKKIKPKPPLWFKQGYRKKPVCDRCGFRSASDQQMTVFHVDGNLKNADWNNLKTICANCKVDLFYNGSKWKTDTSAPGF